MTSLACDFSVTGRRHRILRAHWTVSLTKLERFRFSVGRGAVSKKYLSVCIHMHPPLWILVKWKQVLLWWSEYFRWVNIKSTIWASLSIPIKFWLSSHASVESVVTYSLLPFWLVLVYYSLYRQNYGLFVNQVHVCFCSVIVLV